MAGFWSIVETKESTNFVCFLNIPGKQQCVNLTNEELVYCFLGESIYSGQNQPKGCLPTLYFPSVLKKFRCEERSTSTLYKLHIYKQPIEHTLESLSAGRGKLNSKMPKKFHVYPSINKSTERHPRVPYHSPATLYTIANHCSLHCILIPQVGLLWMHRELRSTFFRSEGIGMFHINYEF